MSETLQFADLGDHGPGKSMLDALVTGERRDRLSIALGYRQYLHFLTVGGEDVVEAFQLV